MEINVNGEFKYLDIIDMRTGMSWVADLLGNYNAYTVIDDIATMTEEDYLWWKDLIERYQTADNAYCELLEELGKQRYDDYNTSMYDQLREEVSNINCDIEDFPFMLNKVCESYVQSY